MIWSVIAPLVDPTLPAYQVDIDVVDSWLRIAGEIIAVVVFVAWIRKRADKKAKDERDEQEERILTAVIQRTAAVQPGYRNGGESLADVANETKRQGRILDSQQDLLHLVHEQVQETRNELTEHRVSVAGQFSSFRDERTAILDAAEAQTRSWAVALGKHGIDVPHPANYDESL